MVRRNSAQQARLREHVRRIGGNCHICGTPIDALRWEHERVLDRQVPARGKSAPRVVLGALQPLASKRRPACSVCPQSMHCRRMRLKLALKGHVRQALPPLQGARGSEHQAYPRRGYMRPGEL